MKAKDKALKYLMGATKCYAIAQRVPKALDIALEEQAKEIFREIHEEVGILTRNKNFENITVKEFLDLISKVYTSYEVKNKSEQEEK